MDLITKIKLFIAQYHSLYENGKIRYNLIQTGGNPVILITGWIALAYVSKLLI